ncbi:hypothetical protein ASG87_03965 [Frateuria sp. Soil773]|nr:hypothetical protein ASG87_03965 [Frateuria sp. Soil773]
MQFLDASIRKSTLVLAFPSCNLFPTFLLSLDQLVFAFGAIFVPMTLNGTHAHLADGNQVDDDFLQHGFKRRVRAV